MLSALLLIEELSSAPTMAMVGRRRFESSLPPEEWRERPLKRPRGEERCDPLLSSAFKAVSLRRTPEVEKNVDEKWRWRRTMDEECGLGRFTLLRRLEGSVLDLQSLALLATNTESGMLPELSEFELPLTGDPGDDRAGRTGSSSTSGIVSDDCTDFCFVKHPDGGLLLPCSSRLRTLSSDDLKE